MTNWIDARIPVVFGPGTDPVPDEALLVSADAAGEGAREAVREPVLVDAAVARFALRSGPHDVGCACCAPRGPVSEALGRLFQARARGEAPFFRRVRVLAGPAGQAAVRAALTADPLVSSLYRAEP